MNLNNGKLTILVTGANGFLGQFVVKLLQENDYSVAKIICFDSKPYYNKLEYQASKPMRVIQSDICDEKMVNLALDNVDCVINCAAVTCHQMKVDTKSVMASNLQGVEVLLSCCIRNNVKYFVQVSTVDVVCGQEPIYFGAENTSCIAKKPIFPLLMQSKYEAELRVMKSNGIDLKDGSGKLKTVILRPTILYGENDPYFVTEFMRQAKGFNNVLPRIDNIYSRTQATYVGNAAWACIKAKDKLVSGSNIGGEEFFITDDTEIEDAFDFVKPFLESQNLHVAKKTIPFWMVYYAIRILMILIVFIKPFYRYELPERFNLKKIQYICTTYFFNRTKATLRLEYEPFYSKEESFQRSLQYYKSLKIS